MRNNVLLFKKIKINGDLYIYNPVNVVSGYYEYANNRSFFRADSQAIYKNMKDLNEKKEETMIGIGYPISDINLLTRFREAGDNLLKAKEEYLKEAKNNIYLCYKDVEYCLPTKTLSSNITGKLGLTIDVINNCLENNNEKQVKMLLRDLKEVLLSVDQVKEDYEKQSKSNYSMIIKKANEENDKEEEVDQLQNLKQAILKRDQILEQIKEPIEKLNRMVGLVEVKEEVNKLVNYLVYKEMTKGNLDLEELNLNMMFTGNPGTGKTTVAQIFADILCKLGYLKNNKVKVIGAQHLISDHVGGTGVKTQKLIESCKGGVIIIDEAYVLASEGTEKFSNDCFGIILTEMQKKETVFIFAGYEREMERFINFNSGLKSRIGIRLNFKNYNLEELYLMLINKIEEVNKDNALYKLHFQEDGLEAAKNLIEKAMENRDFGNARFVENLKEAILREKAKIVEKCYNFESLEELEKMLYSITADDIPQYLVENTKSKEKVLGFQPKK